MTTNSERLTSLTSPSAVPLPETSVRRLIWKMAVATLALMAIGSATRVMNAGLACPDWPLCYGQLIPTRQMNLQVFLEWFHRLDASLIGLSAITLCGLTLWWHKQLPVWLPRTSVFALGLIVFQGVLGGLTVTQMLRFDIVTAHLGTALIFYCTLLIMATALLPFTPMGTVKRLAPASVIAAGLIYAQSLLGGLVASRWALHQCYTGFQLCAVMNSHILGVVPATVGTLVVWIWAWRSSSLHPWLRRLAHMAAGLVVLQILLGVATFWLHLQAELLTVSHQFIGAVLLGALVCFSVLAFRDRAAVNVR